MRRLAVRCLLWLPLMSFSADGARAEIHLGMGFRVGEVTQTTAIVWTRITAAAAPNWRGEPPRVKESPTRAMVRNDPIPIGRREGALLGSPGEVRLIWSRQPDLLQDAATGPWCRVDDEGDYTHQFRLTGLERSCPGSIASRQSHDLS